MKLLFWWCLLLPTTVVSAWTTKSSSRSRLLSSSSSPSSLSRLNVASVSTETDTPTKDDGDDDDGTTSVGVDDDVMMAPMLRRRRRLEGGVVNIQTPFKNVMAANRAEIAVRIMRAATELNAGTVAIYVKEDRYSQHRWGADRSYQLERKDGTSTPISAYLDIEQIIQVAKDAGVDAIHPGYGFLSESSMFAKACADNNITFVGPTIENLETFADKTAARNAAIAANVPVVPGSDSALQTSEEVVAFVEEIGLPVIIKAAMGGGGKGMRVVKTMDELVPFYEQAKSEALTSFGNGDVFIERYIDRPRHIEIQIVGDGTGNVVHLYERDCSVQRRHQKVLEMAPAWNLSLKARKQLHEYAISLTSKAKYKNAGTVEFLVDSSENIYFIEVNPRIQVEHTVTEEVTGVDLVQSQILIAAGASLQDVGLIQSEIRPRGVALQCRVTTENPEKNFAPDTGTVTLYRHSAGKGVRMDGIGYSGLAITPYFDSMIVKYTATGADFDEAVARMKRVLQECRIRGVETNIGFLLNVLSHPAFQDGAVTTAFISENPELLQTSSSVWDFANADQTTTKSTMYAERKIRYLANLALNGHPKELGADVDKLQSATATSIIQPPKITKETNLPKTTDGGWRKVLQDKGPEGFAKAIREHNGLLVMDTTWRDAHQSLLATRMRTQELMNCAEYTNIALNNAYSMEMWGGATFDVSMRFLRECPWERLELLREKVPDVPFQMLLRGANAVGYTNYPDNVVKRFTKQAYESGIDIFRVFDSLNYLDNMLLGMDAVAATNGGVCEAAMSYTGNVADTSKGKYNLEYYMKLARDLIDQGCVHTLAIKDMAGLLTPNAADMLVSALREEFPDTVLHVHTHDTGGNGVAAMLAASAAGADVVDVAMDAMSGMTSQPSIGSLVATLQNDPNYNTGLDLGNISTLNAYWEKVRGLYAPFESGQLSGSSDVYIHEIPGGQYTNLLYQSKQLGLTDRWDEIKKHYAIANKILGDIPKVTPSSKVVGDLAQFMVAQGGMSKDEFENNADTLAVPDSVVKFLRGEIGIPPGGFPEPLRSKVLDSRGLQPVDGRPGKSLPDYDFDKEAAKLKEKYGESAISDKDVLSHALYPDVFVDWKAFQQKYGDVGTLPTNLFLNPMKKGDEVEWDRSDGKKFILKLIAIEDEIRPDGTRMVLISVNGEPWYMPIVDIKAMENDQGKTLRRMIDADGGSPGQVGSPMPGVVISVEVEAGQIVKEGETVATLSAMKMETSIPASMSGIIQDVYIKQGDKVEADQLIMEIEEK